MQRVRRLVRDVRLEQAVRLAVQLRVPCVERRRERDKVLARARDPAAVVVAASAVRRVAHAGDLRRPRPSARAVEPQHEPNPAAAEREPRLQEERRERHERRRVRGEHVGIRDVDDAHRVVQAEVKPHDEPVGDLALLDVHGGHELSVEALLQLRPSERRRARPGWPKTSDQEQ